MLSLSPGVCVHFLNFFKFKFDLIHSCVCADFVNLAPHLPHQHMTQYTMLLVILLLYEACLHDMEHRIDRHCIVFTVS